jgi:hypothetical protein
MIFIVKLIRLVSLTARCDNASVKERRNLPARGWINICDSTRKDDTETKEARNSATRFREWL